MSSVILFKFFLECPTLLCENGGLASLFLIYHVFSALYMSFSNSLVYVSRCSLFEPSKVKLNLTIIIISVNLLSNRIWMSQFPIRPFFSTWRTYLLSLGELVLRLLPKLFSAWRTVKRCEIDSHLQSSSSSPTSVANKYTRTRPSRLQKEETVKQRLAHSFTFLINYGSALSLQIEVNIN